MITVETVQKKIDKSAKISNAVNEEVLKTGTVKATKQSYWPWIFLGAAGIIGGYLLLKNGKQSNGEISGEY
jgi:hypothetical protein